MNKKLILILLVFAVVSVSCNLLTGSNVSGVTRAAETDTPGLPSTPTPSSQAQGISAESQSEAGVLLSWEPISGAEQYLLEIQVGNTFIPLALLPAAQTSFQDEIVPADTRLTYRLNSLVGTEKIVSKEIIVETQPETIRPVQVGVEFDISSPLLDFDPENFDPASIDPNNFDPAMFIPQPVESEALIGPQGGEVSVTGSSGVLYTLVVPPNALRMEVTIQLKPISAISDLPLSGGLMAAVFIAPADLVFDIPAQLVMTPPADLAPAAAPLVLGFAFEDEGQEFHLYPLDPDAKQSRAARAVASLESVPLGLPPLSDIANLQNGGGYGVGSATLGDVKQIIKKSPAKSQNRTAQRLAASQLDELAPIPNILDELVPLQSIQGMQLAKIGVSMLQKAINANDWSKFLEAMDDVRTYLNAGGDKYNAELNQLMLDMLATKAQALLLKNKGDCLTYEDFAAQDLVERLTNPKDQFSFTLAAIFKAKFGQ